MNAADNLAEFIKRLPVEREPEAKLHERIVRARVENVLHDLTWLVEQGRLDVNNNAWRFALNAQANAQALARKIGL